MGEILSVVHCLIPDILVIAIKIKLKLVKIFYNVIM